MAKTPELWDVYHLAICKEPNCERCGQYREPSNPASTGEKKMTPHEVTRTFRSSNEKISDFPSPAPSEGPKDGWYACSSCGERYKKGTPCDLGCADVPSTTSADIRPRTYINCPKCGDYVRHECGVYEATPSQPDAGTLLARIRSIAHDCLQSDDVTMDMKWVIQQIDLVLASSHSGATKGLPSEYGLKPRRKFNGFCSGAEKDGKG